LAAALTASANAPTFGSTRSRGPEMPTAEITFPWRSKTGAAMPHTEARHSPRLTA
jgi:hypothetical protein